MADATVKFETDVDDKATKKLNDLGGTLKKIGGLVVAAFAVDKIIDFGKESLKAFEEGEKIQTQMKNAVKNAKDLGEGYTKTAEGINEATNALMDYSSELQKSTAYDDEAIAQAETKLLQAGLSIDAIKQLTPAIMDQVSATESLDNADAALVGNAEMLGKAINGNVGVLARMNIHLTDAEEKQFKLMTTQERAEFIATNLGTAYGGAATAMAQTTEGSIKAMNEQWSNFQQTIGGYIAPIIQQILAFGTQLLTEIPKFMAELQTLWDTDWGGIRSTVEGVLKWFNDSFLPAFNDFVQEVQDTFSPMVQFFTEHWNEIKTVFDLAFVGLKLLWEEFWLGIQTAFTIAWEIIKGLIKTAFSLLKGDWKGAWDEINTMFKGIWDALGTLVDGSVKNIQTAISDAWKVVSGAFDTLKTNVTATWNGMWSSLMSFATGIISSIQAAVTRLAQSIEGALEAINSLARRSGALGMGAMMAQALADAGHRAVGGPVRGGKSYLVGEKGPERFVPGMNGSIIPNEDLGKGGGKNVNIVFNFNGTVSSKEVALEYADYVVRELKLSNAVV